MRAVRRPTTALVAVISSAVAAATMSVGALGLSIPAAADDGTLVTEPTATPTLAPTDTPTQASQRKITSKIKQKTFNVYLLYGTVQDLPSGTAMLQKKTCVACKWDVVRRVSTNEKGWYKTKIFAPAKGKKNLWRIMVPTSAGYAKSYSRVWATLLQ